MMGRRARFALALLFCVGFGSILAEGHDHDLPAAVVMDTFIKIEPERAHLVIRIPLDLLRSLSFPVVNGDYDMTKVGPSVATALRALAHDLTLSADGRKLVPLQATGRIVGLSDRSFEDFQTAVAAIASSPASDTRIGFELGYLDAHFVYSISSARSVFAIQSKVAEDLESEAKLVVRYLPLRDGSRTMTITSGSDPVLLNPTWYQVANGFAQLGIKRLVGGIDDLLFLLCLVIPFRRVKQLAPIIVVLAAGESATFIGTAHGIAPAGAWFLPFVETGIAVSILYLALENIVGANLRRRWILAALSGLFFGFSFAATFNEQVQFSGSYPLVSLLSFNVGIIIGQLVALCIFVPALALLFRGAMAGRIGIIVLSAIIAHTAWHWMIDRGGILWQTPWPQVSGPGLMVLARWVLALGFVVGAAAFLSKWLDRRHPALIESNTVPGQD
jgi:HupE / UreJ protein